MQFFNYSTCSSYFNGNAFQKITDLLKKCGLVKELKFIFVIPRMQKLSALDGLIVVIQGMAERITNGSANSKYSPVNLDLL